MTNLRTALLLCVALLGLLVACDDDAGAPCHYDYQCRSNSCTFGTCDSLLGHEIADAILSDDEAADEEPQANPEQICENLDPASCTAPHCMVQSFCGTQQTCAERLDMGLGCPLCNDFDCKAPCMKISACYPR